MRKKACWEITLAVYYLQGIERGGHGEEGKREIILSWLLDQAEYLQLPSQVHIEYMKINFTKYQVKGDQWCN